MNALWQVLDHRKRGVVGHVDGEHLHLAEQRIDICLINVGGQVAAPQRGIQRLGLGLQNLGHDLGVIGLEQFRPGVADDFDIWRKLFKVVDKLCRRIAAVSIIGRTRCPSLQSLRLGNGCRIAPADDRVMDALTRGAERIRNVLFRIGRQRRGFRIGVDTEDAEIARDLVHRERTG